MLAIIHYILLTARRDWLFLGLLLAVLIASFLSIFVGSTALTEQASMQIAFLSSANRMILVVGMVLFICFHVRRAFENREIEFVLSHAISREQFVIAYFLAFVVLAIILILPVLITIHLFFNVEFWAAYYWTVSLLLELVLVSTFSFLSSLILGSAVSAVLASFGFYLVSRLMGFATAYIILPNNIQNYDATSFMELILKGFSIVLPRLDLFTKSKWLVYSEVDLDSLQIVFIQSLIYLPFLLLMTILDFKRKQF